MFKTRLNLLLLVPPVLFAAAEQLFLIDGSGFYKADGLIGAVSLALSIGCAAAMAAGLSTAHGYERRLPHAACIPFFAVAGWAACKIILTFLKLGMTDKGFVKSVAIIDAVRSICMLFAIFCFAAIGVAVALGREPKIGFAAVPASIGLLLDLLMSFLASPVNRTSAWNQKLLFSQALAVLFLIELLSRAAQRKLFTVTRHSAAHSAAALIYGVCNLLPLLFAGTDVVQKACLAGVPLLITFAGFTLINKTESENAK